MVTKSQLEALVARSLEVEDPPAYTSTNDVPIGPIGEPLSLPIFWQGRQWAVTSYGIEERSGKYVIAGDRAWESNDGHGWVQHMEEKSWVDLPDFVEALRIARGRWPKGGAA